MTAASAMSLHSFDWLPKEDPIDGGDGDVGCRGNRPRLVEGLRVIPLLLLLEVI
jgi:hypothetical protein